MTDLFFHGDYGLAPTNQAALFLALLLSFAAGHAIAWVYMFTHSGLSYSRSYVNTLVVLPVVVALVMMVLANNVVLALGLMAIFAMVRFRTILRDSLDTAYVLAVVVVGLACGTQKFATAAVGCLFTALIMLYFWYTSFGTRHRYDVIINLHWARSLTDLAHLRNLLTRHSRKARCASQRSNEGYGGTDLSYRLLLRDPARTEDLLGELRSLEGVSRLTCLQSEDESEM